MNDLRLMVPRYGHDVPGLPQRAIVMTNSERGLMACPSRWLFSVADRLKPQAKARPLRYGTAWHGWLEDVHRWWVAYDIEYPGTGTGCVWFGGDGRVGLCQCHDDGRCGSGPCTKCGGTGTGPLATTRTAWLAHAAGGADSEYTMDTAEREADTLHRAAEGWARVYSLRPPDEYRVVAVEKTLAVPILGPNGNPFTGTVWLAPSPGGGWYLAGTGEGHLPGARRVRWPWYQCMTLDAVLQHRRTGLLYVAEHKSAKAPARRVQAVSVDPQLAGYMWGAQVGVDAGLLPGVAPGTRVAGYVYDVASNQYQHDPRLLAPKKVQLRNGLGEPLYHQTKADGGGMGTKETRRRVWDLDAQGEPLERSPGLSRDPRAGVPSWRYEEALARHGFARAEYDGHLLDLMATVDTRLYQRFTGTSGPEVGARYAREVYATAKRLAAWRRAAATIRTQADRELRFPRQPVCMFGGGCAYRGPCLQDGALVRRDYDEADTQRWMADTPTAPKGAGAIEW